MACLQATLHRFLGDRRGMLVPLFGLSLIPAIGLAGAVLDYSRAMTNRMKLQQAVDAAAVAGLSASSDRDSAASRIFGAVFQTPTGMTLRGPTFTPNADGTYTVAATLSVPTTLSSVLGRSSLDVGGTATAARSAGTTTTTTTTAPTASICVLLLSTSASQSLLVNGGAKVNAKLCEIHVHSTANPAAIFNGGVVLDVKRVCVKGSRVIQNNGTVSGLETNCPAVADPFAGTMPPPPSTSCNYSNQNYNGGSIILNPGVYCGHFNFNGSPIVTFNPGVYVIKGGSWNVNGGSWTGNGVTFYFDDDSRIQFNSGMTTNLTPPSSGTYANILFYEKAGLSPSQFILNDERGQNLKGLIYLPSRNVIFNSGSVLWSHAITMVFNTLILNATTWNLESGPKTVKTTGGEVGS